MVTKIKRWVETGIRAIESRITRASVGTSMAIDTDGKSSSWIDSNHQGCI